MARKKINILKYARIKEENNINKRTIFFLFLFSLLVICIICRFFGMDFTTIKLVKIYCIAINLVAFVVVGSDKAAAEDNGIFHSRKNSRFSNSNLISIGFAGGALVALISCYLFRHKISSEFLGVRALLFIALIFHGFIWYYFIL